MRELTDQEKVRRDKLEEIKKITNPYPDRFETSHLIKDARLLDDETKDVSLAGRIIFSRKMGKMSFLRISDIDASIQVSLQLNVLGEETYNFFKKYIDIGDFIGVTGEIVTTNTGEKTLRASELKFLGKALRPLPEKFHGLTDEELKYRERYLDLIMNEESRNKFLTRIKFIKKLRNYLEGHDYYEIETPILTNKASGAAAKPFLSHHNALDMNVYLRIAPETYLKRAVVGGFTRVFEIGRCFRNEGIDASHLQDFTMIECYASYYNFEDNMKFIRELLQDIIMDIFNTLEIKIGDNLVDFSGKWPTASFRDLIIKYADIDIEEYNTKEKLLKVIKEKNIELDSDTPIDKLGYGNLVDYLYKKVARPNLIGPMYLISHPTSLSPLSRSNDDNKEIVDRFQLIINGAEVVNGFSELVDPIEQYNRLLEQSKLREAGDEEAMPLDNEYIKSMEYGMPPISGWGMGIDRIVQLLTDSANIRDVVMFPLMRPLDEE